ncbi:MAG: response regulator [Chloroflexi bacterium]|nr:response regulator [Chloroflexota bacterium]
MAEKILIIDDDIDTLRLVGLMLQKEGYQIITANNGKQGLLKMSEETPDLILLDIMMPEMDGYEVARRLRKNPETAETPILMFTAKSQAEDRVSGFEAGADGYLTKPTRPIELQAHIRGLLTHSEKTEAEETTPHDQKILTRSQDQRAFTIGIISERFSDWFTDTPPNEGKA